MKIYTKKGDKGHTNLLFGGRVSKTDMRCEAYGSTDSAVSAMGFARALCEDIRVREILHEVQRQMFIVGAELATDRKRWKDLQVNFSVVTPEMVVGLETYIDELDSQVDLPRSFILPGASAGSGALDLARSLVRTAERRALELHENEGLASLEILRYLNRLSDLMFMLARFEDRELPFELTSDGGE